MAGPLPRGLIVQLWGGAEPAAGECSLHTHVRCQVWELRRQRRKVWFIAEVGVVRVHPGVAGGAPRGLSWRRAGCCYACRRRCRRRRLLLWRCRDAEQRGFCFVEGFRELALYLQPGAPCLGACRGVQLEVHAGWRGVQPPGHQRSTVLLVRCPPAEPPRCQAAPAATRLCPAAAGGTAPPPRPAAQPAGSMRSKCSGARVVTRAEARAAGRRQACGCRCRYARDPRPWAPLCAQIECRSQSAGASFDLSTVRNALNETPDGV
jgi:hypothetical protein